MSKFEFSLIVGQELSDLNTSLQQIDRRIKSLEKLIKKLIDDENQVNKYDLEVVSEYEKTKRITP